MIEYVLVGVIAPISLNLLHLLVGLYVVIQRGSVMSLGFTGISFVTKSMAMIFFLWLGRTRQTSMIFSTVRNVTKI